MGVGTPCSTDGMILEPLAKSITNWCAIYSLPLPSLPAFHTHTHKGFWVLTCGFACPSPQENPDVAEQDDYLQSQEKRSDQGAKTLHVLAYH